jgi:hypothetical protein
MGLDMNLYTQAAQNSQRRDIAEWRKHANLHGHFESLWRARGGDGEFNCIELELTKEDCEEVIRLTEAHELPHTTGFFFGSSDASDDEPTIQAMKEAIREIQNGQTVLYTSWW